MSHFNEREVLDKEILYLHIIIIFNLLVDIPFIENIPEYELALKLLQKSHIIL